MQATLGVLQMEVAVYAKLVVTLAEVPQFVHYVSQGLSRLSREQQLAHLAQLVSSQLFRGQRLAMVVLWVILRGIHHCQGINHSAIYAHPAIQARQPSHRPAYTVAACS